MCVPPSFLDRPFCLRADMAVRASRDTCAIRRFPRRASQVAGPVKEFAQNNPKRLGAWSADCKSHVAHMTDGDFFSSEQVGGLCRAVTVL